MLLLALPDSILVNTLNLVSKNSQQTSHLSVVCKKFKELSNHQSVAFQRQGSIVIRPRLQGLIPYRVANNHTLAALQRLRNHEVKTQTLPSQYHLVEIFD